MNEADLADVKTLISQELLYRPQIPAYFDPGQIDAAVRNFLLSRLQIHIYIVGGSLIVTPYIDGSAGFQYSCYLPTSGDATLNELLTLKEKVKNLEKNVEFLGVAE